MKDWLPRIVIIGLMLIVIGVPFAFRPDKPAIASGDDQNVLVIITPHNEQIRHEFARGFNAYRKANDKPAVRFDWRSSGGTSDLRKQVLSELTKAIRDNGRDARLSYDLFFGGGDYDHGRLAGSITVGHRGESISLSASVSAKVPEELFNKVFPKPTIGGQPLYEENKKWVGVALSSFGIVFNREYLKMINVDEPRTWSDLANEKYAKTVALADPGHSGSISQTYNVILQRMGWNEGWSTLRRVFANSRYFAARSSQVPVDVSNGEAAAGMCIDFYGRFQSGAIGGDRVGYVDPIRTDASGKAVAMTGITADPISVMRGAPHEKLAHEFVTWLLSQEAQVLWQAKKGSPNGTEKFELRRLPIRPDVYVEKHRKHWVDSDVDPYGIATPIRPGTPSYFRYIAPIAHSVAIDVHEELVEAWAAIRRTPKDHPNHAEMLELFDAMPQTITLTWPDEDLAKNWKAILGDAGHVRHDEAAKALKDFTGSIKSRWKDENQKLNDRLEWTLFFRENYRKIIELSRS